MVFSLGELLVEIFRKGKDIPFDRAGEFLGPYPSGAPAIFCHAMACLGQPTGFFATIGKDNFGKCLLEKCRRSSIDTRWITELDEHTTGVAFTLFHHDGSREFIYHSRHAAVGQFSPAHLDEEALAKADWLHLCGNVLGISPSTRQASYRAVEIAHQNNVKISFDPNIRFEMMKPDEIQQLCGPVVEKTTLLLPSGSEAEHLSGINGEEHACRALLDKGPDIVALKQGSHGSTIFTRDQQFHAEPFRVEEIDPTGAGDCYDAGFVFGLLQGWQLSQTAQFANALGALTVTRQGAMEADIGLEDVQQFMRMTVES